MIKKQIDWDLEFLLFIRIFIGKRVTIATKQNTKYTGEFISINFRKREVSLSNTVIKLENISEVNCPSGAMKRDIDACLNKNNRRKSNVTRTKQF